jgi:DNA-binding MarR family transcriptional regulator
MVNPLLIFKDKQLRIILALRDSSKDWNISDLAKATDTTYAHSCNFITACVKAGLVTGEKHGKIKVIRLSDRGKKVAESLYEVYNAIRPDQQGPQKAAQPAQQNAQETKE